MAGKLPTLATVTMSTTLPIILLFLFFAQPRLLHLQTFPGIPLHDEADDLALFNRAILNEAPPSSAAATKIAFLFLTNSDLVFAPLWEKFFSGHSHLYNIYVHADPRTPISPPGGVFHGRFVPAKPTRRASPSLISAARRLIANAMLDDVANAFFAVLSQHCVPLHSFPFVHRTLFGFNSSHAVSFVEIFANRSILADRYAARGRTVMLPEVSFHQFRGGSQFFVLKRPHALLVVADRELWEKFRLPCLRSSKYTCYPEEHYFPTLLSMKDPDGCSRYTLTNVRWAGTVDGHPYTYRAGEISPELVWNLRRFSDLGSNSSYLFARKFAPGCLRPLMGIADSVIFRD